MNNWDTYLYPVVQAGHTGGIFGHNGATWAHNGMDMARRNYNEIVALNHVSKQPLDSEPFE